MERLTKYLASGAADYNYPAGCYSGNDCNDRVAKSAYRQTCVERLAAYEETGLTPEESKRMSNILMDVGIDYNCSWEYVKNWLLDDRLRELYEADKDGRLVVLPFTSGRTLLYKENIDSPQLMKDVELAIRYCSSCGIVFHMAYNVFCDLVKHGRITAVSEETENVLGAMKNE